MTRALASDRALKRKRTSNRWKPIGVWALLPDGRRWPVSNEETLAGALGTARALRQSGTSQFQHRLWIALRDEAAHVPWTNPRRAARRGKDAPRPPA